MFGRQPTKQELQQIIKQYNVKSVVNQRLAHESGFLQESEEVCRSLDCEYVHLPLPSPAALCDFKLTDRMVQAMDELPQPIFVQCARGIRAGALSTMFHATRSTPQEVNAVEDKPVEVQQWMQESMVRKYAERGVVGPTVKHMFHSDSNTCAFVVWDPREEFGREAAIIDPAADWNPNNARLKYDHAQRMVDFVKDRGLKLKYILETHVHADHITAAPFIKDAFPEAEVGIGEHITDVQKVFAPKFGMDSLRMDGTQFDILFRDNDTLQIGGLSGRVLHTPGHTPACVTYNIGDALFTGDVGTGRCDFPGGSAPQMWQSLQKILSFPADTRVFTGHDYPDGRPVACESSVAEQRRHNVHLDGGVEAAEFITMRSARDAALQAPRDLLASLQCNIDAGRLPAPDAAGNRFVKLPLNVL